MTNHADSGVERIGAKIRRLRQLKELGQDRLAIKAGVDQSSLSKVERGAGKMGETSLRRLAAALGIAFEELIADTDFRQR